MNMNLSIQSTIAPAMTIPITRKPVFDPVKIWQLSAASWRNQSVRYRDDYNREDCPVMRVFLHQRAMDCERLAIEDEIKVEEYQKGINV